MIHTDYHIDVVELRKAMIDAGIENITELSSKSGVNRNTISGILSRKIYPSADVMKRIAASLNLDSSKAGKIFFAVSLRTA